MGLSTHVLDTASGHPAAGLPVVALLLVDGAWLEVGSGETDGDGRVADLVADLGPGRYRVVFDTSSVLGDEGWLPSVTVEFRVQDGESRVHVPLLLSPYGYTTYRGS